jgi:hypothetical protein
VDSGQNAWDGDSLERSSIGEYIDGIWIAAPVNIKKCEYVRVMLDLHKDKGFGREERCDAHGRFKYMIIDNGPVFFSFFQF